MKLSPTALYGWLVLTQKRRARGYSGSRIRSTERATLGSAIKRSSLRRSVSPSTHCEHATNDGQQPRRWARRGFGRWRFGHHEDRTPAHGYAATREAAMAAFAKSWRRG